VCLESRDQPGDSGVVDVWDLGERWSEERSPSAFLDEVGELPAQPALEDRDRFVLQ
jgi:hypothetical protein